MYIVNFNKWGKYFLSGVTTTEAWNTWREAEGNTTLPRKGFSQILRGGGFGTRDTTRNKKHVKLICWEGIPLRPTLLKLVKVHSVDRVREELESIAVELNPDNPF